MLICESMSFSDILSPAGCLERALPTQSHGWLGIQPRGHRSLRRVPPPTLAHSCVSSVEDRFRIQSVLVPAPRLGSERFWITWFLFGSGRHGPGMSAEGARQFFNPRGILL
jgi:hypothetical protein